MNIARFNFFSFIFIFSLSVIVDQMFKFFATEQHIVQLNTGFSLNWFPGFDQVVLGLLLLAFLIAIGKSWDKTWTNYSGWAGLFFGGAFSNIVDRLLYNGVRDWMDVPIFNLKNNLADWFLCIGLIVIVARYLWQEHTQTRSIKKSRYAH